MSDNLPDFHLSHLYKVGVRCKVSGIHSVNNHDYENKTKVEKHQISPVSVHLNRCKRGKINKGISYSWF